MRKASRLASSEDILAYAAHELRLPLSHIKGFVTSLGRTDVTWDDETRKEFISEIDRETDRLAELIDSLMSSSGRPTRAQDAFIDPAVVIRGALQRVRGVVGDRPLRQEVPMSLPAVRMNAAETERVLANLIQNAIKYSPPHTSITISARLSETHDLEFLVEDEGPGIAPEDRKHIFEPFFRQQTAQQSNVPGHGLGLAICQSIVLAHGGRIEVSDRPGGGACFSVFLPAQVRPEQFDVDSQAKDRGNDSANHSCCGRRGANAPIALQQSEGKRLRRAVGGGRLRGTENHRGASTRPGAP
jgi:two-component system, OmpR family, sensor histidine kinase KdpD